MRKYYYYVVKSGTRESCAVCCSDDGFFPLKDSISFSKERFNELVIINFWSEISKEEYEFFAKNNK